MPASYRNIAESNLDKAAKELNATPPAGESIEVMNARSARAQTLATVAAAQALLYIGDVLAGRDTDFTH